MQNTSIEPGAVCADLAQAGRAVELWEVLALTSGGEQAYCRSLTTSQSRFIDRDDLWVMVDTIP